MERLTTQCLPAQRPDTDEPVACVESLVEEPVDHELAERVARFVDKVERGRPRRADSPVPATLATANTLLDDRDILARRLRWYGAGATLFAVACLVFALWQELAPPVERTHAAHRTTVEAFYTIDETVRIGDMTVFVSHITSFARRARLHFFAVNPGDKAQPGGVSLSDGEGNEIEVIPANHKVRARTIEHRSVGVGKGFNPRSVKRWRRKLHERSRAP